MLDHASGIATVVTASDTNHPTAATAAETLLFPTVSSFSLHFISSTWESLFLISRTYFACLPPYFHMQLLQLQPQRPLPARLRHCFPQGQQRLVQPRLRPRPSPFPACPRPPATSLPSP
jgi:hypothetical protein